MSTVRLLALAFGLLLAAYSTSATAGAPTSWEPEWRDVTTLICADQVAVSTSSGDLCCGDRASCASAFGPSADLPAARVDLGDVSWTCAADSVFKVGETLCCGDAHTCASATQGGPVPPGKILEVLTVPAGAREGWEPVDAAFCGAPIKVQCCGHECCGTVDACASWCKIMCAVTSEPADPGDGVDRCVPLPWAPEDEAEL